MSRSFHADLPAVAAFALSLAGCTRAPLTDGGARLNYSSQLEAVVPVTSLIDRRFITVVRQQYDFSCGSAALATLLRYHYNDAQTEQTVFIGMFRDGDRVQIQRQGFSLLDMKRYLAARGVGADGYRVTIDQIEKAHVPGIVLINFNGYKHFVVVKGVAGQTVLLGDPSLGLRRESRVTFMRQWNGVFFVLNGRNDMAARHFNAPADVALAPAARFNWAAEPLSLSGLELTRPLVLPAPLPREF
jgi:predicted double-glycine peptidase